MQERGKNLRDKCSMTRMLQSVTKLAREALFNGISRSLFAVSQRSLNVAEYIAQANSVGRCRSRDWASVKLRNDCRRAIPIKHNYLRRVMTPLCLRIDDRLIWRHFNLAVQIGRHRGSIERNWRILP